MPILDFSTNVRAVAKVIKEGKDLNAGDETEDSDYEIETNPELASGSTSEGQADSKEQTKPVSFPHLTQGTFARYARSIQSW